jgi:AcrR family transcriptional regulator
MDGRAQRSARTQALITKAVYDLVRAQSRFPTALEVARHAGVGERTVFRQFRDLETLGASIHALVAPEVMLLARMAPPTGDLEADVIELVSRRARIFEFITPFQRAVRAYGAGLRMANEQNVVMAATMRAGIEATLGPHLGARPRDKLEVIDVLLSFDAWERLRAVQTLEAAHAERVLREAVLVLLRR